MPLFYPWKEVPHVLRLYILNSYLCALIFLFPLLLSFFYNLSLFVTFYRNLCIPHLFAFLSFFPVSLSFFIVQPSSYSQILQTFHLLPFSFLFQSHYFKPQKVISVVVYLLPQYRLPVQPELVCLEASHQPWNHHLVLLGFLLQVRTYSALSGGLFFSLAEESIDIIERQT